MHKQFPGWRLQVLAVLLVLSSLAVATPVRASSAPEAIVSSTTLNVRQGPGTGYTVIGVAHASDVLPVIGQDGTGWLEVSLVQGSTGWVSSDYVVVSGDLSSTPHTTAAAAATAAPPGTATTAGAAQSGNGSTLIFQVSSGGQIYAVNADGTNLRALTTGMDPALSPDGQQVVFTRWEGVADGVNGSLWVINIDGSGERQVLAGVRQAKSPTWSADGKQIVISPQQAGTVKETYLCIVDGKQVTAPDPIDGQRCMPQAADPHWGLRLVDVATGAHEDLPREAHSFAPTWDPAQAWHIVFRGDKGLESLDLNQKTIWVLKAGGAYRGPVFAPDGSKLAVTYKQNDHWEVHVMHADGSGEVRLTETPKSVILDAELAGQTVRQWNNAAPTWSPDGSQIAYITDRNGFYELWVMNADGSNQHPLVTTAALGGAGIQYDGADERVISWR
jgi:hypothetical protein